MSIHIIWKVIHLVLQNLKREILLDAFVVILCALSQSWHCLLCLVALRKEVMMHLISSLIEDL